LILSVAAERALHAPGTITFEFGIAITWIAIFMVSAHRNLTK